MYASTKDAIINGTIKIKHNTVCLIISPFTVDVLSTFTSALYNFKALTLNIKIIGITIIFCKNSAEIENIIPFPKA